MSFWVFQTAPSIPPSHLYHSCTSRIKSMKKMNDLLIFSIVFFNIFNQLEYLIPIFGSDCYQVVNCLTNWMFKHNQVDYVQVVESSMHKDKQDNNYLPKCLYMNHRRCLYSRLESWIICIINTILFLAS